jgi:hypothetical protein
MRAKTGGEWVFTIHIPEGKDYPNRTIIREIIRDKTIVHKPFDVNFIAIIEFKTTAEKQV